jgi:hypothetical protein
MTNETKGQGQSKFDCKKILDWKSNKLKHTWWGPWDKHTWWGPWDLTSLEHGLGLTLVLGTTIGFEFGVELLRQTKTQLMGALGWNVAGVWSGPGARAEDNTWVRAWT